MKQWKYLSLVTIVLIFVTSCVSPVHIQQDNAVNLTDYKTYMWVDTRANEKDSAARATAYADISIRNAANAALVKAGWKAVEDNPDALIGYDVLVERSAERRSDPVYSQAFTRSYYNRFTRRWNTIYYPQQLLGYDNYEVPVKESTVTISIMDAKTDKGIWQGWITESMNYSRLTNTEISHAVNNIFKKFKTSTR